MDTFCQNRITVAFGLLCSLATLKVNGYLQCPSEVFVQQHTNESISCNISFKFARACWYSGVYLRILPPIVCLEAGRSHCTQGYDISLDGSLIIINAGTDHEGVYTAAFFHPNNTYETDTLNLTTFAHPSSFYPVINRCHGRRTCSIMADYRGHIVCAVYNARPPVELNLSTNGEGLVKTSLYHSSGNNTGLTNTFIEAEYELAECSKLTIITCTASGVAMTNQVANSSISFYDPCFFTATLTYSEKPHSAKDLSSVLMIIFFVVLLVVIIISTTIIAGVCYVRKKITRDVRNI